MLTDLIVDITDEKHYRGLVEKLRATFSEEIVFRKRKILDTKTVL